MLSFYFLVAYFMADCAYYVSGSWGDPNSGQYHIQTDEGPERYFRYQTDNGQYRKEKRLEDGTVIGTEAWIDSLGYMRLKDYIADNQGYRILKSNTVFVGVDRPIQDAIKAAKKAPAEAGILYNPSNSANKIPVSSKPNSISYNPLGYDHYKTPNVFIKPNSQPSSVYVSKEDGSKVKIPSDSIETPFTSNDDISKPLAIYSPSSKPSSAPSAFGKDLDPIAVYPPNSNNLLTNSIYSTTPVPSTTVRPYIESDNSNSIDVQPVFNRNGYRFNNRPPRPPQSHQYYNQNQLGDGYYKQLPLYDGVSSTSKGFRYVLPRQYHEEDNTNPDNREGSFGYIDPFGIRRVIYYNASPRDGFQFRKNNRYVGFNATPYDPRPL